MLRSSRRSLAGGGCDVAAGVRSGTRRWVEALVVREKLCPFAARSALGVAVETFGLRGAALADAASAPPKEDDGSVWTPTAVACARGIDRAVVRVDRLFCEEDDQARTTLMLVWPAGLDCPFLFSKFCESVVDAAKLSHGAIDDPDAVQLSKRGVGFPFHPGFDGAQFAAPFPTLHVIPRAALEAARATAVDVIGRNARRLDRATDEDLATWRALTAVCRGALLRDDALLDPPEAQRRIAHARRAQRAWEQARLASHRRRRRPQRWRNARPGLPVENENSDNDDDQCEYEPVRASDS